MNNPNEFQRQLEELIDRSCNKLVDAVFEELSGRRGLDIRENINYDDDIEKDIRDKLKTRFVKIIE